MLEEKSLSCQNSKWSSDQKRSDKKLHSLIAFKSSIYTVSHIHRQTNKQTNKHAYTTIYILWLLSVGWFVSCVSVVRQWFEHHQQWYFKPPHWTHFVHKNPHLERQYSPNLIMMWYGMTVLMEDINNLNHYMNSFLLHLWFYISFLCCKNEDASKFIYAKKADLWFSNNGFRVMDRAHKFRWFFVTSVLDLG